MRWRRRPGGDRGSFTAELAAGLPALMLLLIAGLTAVVAVTTKIQCVDAAWEGARAAARGESGTVAAARTAGPGSTIDVDRGTELVTVTVSSPVRLLGSHLPAITVTGRAVAAVEPGGTTAEPGGTTAEPSGTTAEPSGTTADSGGTTADPSVTTPGS